MHIFSGSLHLQQMIPDGKLEAGHGHDHSHGHGPPATGHRRGDGHGSPTHLYDLLDVLDLVDELHLCHPPDVLELPDQTQQKQKQ